MLTPKNANKVVQHPKHLGIQSGVRLKTTGIWIQQKFGSAGDYFSLLFTTSQAEKRPEKTKIFCKSLALAGGALFLLTA